MWSGLYIRFNGQCLISPYISDDRHEYISGYYRVSVYFLSKIMSDIALRTITSVIFSCIVYFMIGKTSVVVDLWNTLDFDVLVQN